MAAKNILFISYDGMTDPLGQSQVIPYLKGIAKAGYHFFLLSCEKKAVFEKNKLTVQKLLDAANITWVPVSYTKTPPVLSTIYDIYRLKRKAAQIHRKHGLSMVHTRPGIPALVGLWMKKKFGVKFLHDIREFYADSRVDGKMWDLQQPVYRNVYRYFKQKENEEEQQCDGAVCLTYAAEKILRSSNAALPAKTPLKVIPCSADMELFNPAAISENDRLDKMKKLGLSATDVVVSYLGSIGGWYMTDEMLGLCKKILDRVASVKFLFISPHRHEVIVDAARRFGIDASKIITTHASRTEVPLLLSLSSYSIFFIKPCYSKLSSSPTKHGELMAMGIPVIANSGVGDVKEIVEKYNAGFVLEGFGEEDFSMLVDKIAAEPVFDKAMIRKAALEFYSLQPAIEKYVDLYYKILE